MLTLSRKIHLAISAVLDIAYNIGDQPVQSQVITARHHVPKRYLEPVLQQLVRDGILLSLRGPKGGYKLARERAKISLGDVARSISMVDMEENAANNQTELAGRILLPVWQTLSIQMLTFLDTITLQELCNRAHQLNINSEIAASLDFTI
jgi:Rrf2 family transcriptional regulator, iron-sulfur cluster assembly transcription factor